MNRSFDGDFRSKPKVSIRGSNKVESKEELLIRAQEARQKRGAFRMENESAIKIQSFVRGCFSRKRTRDELRFRFDGLKQEFKNDPSVDQKAYLSSLLLNFFRSREDGERICWLCQSFVKGRSSVVEKIASSDSLEWPLLLARLLKAALIFLSKSGGSENVAPLFRFNEIFSDAETYEGGKTSRTVRRIYNYLMAENYFIYIREVCDARIPPILEETRRPPTPAAGAILAMITRPLTVVSGFETSMKDSVFVDLTNSFFFKQFSEQVELFILPSLSKEATWFDDWILALSRNVDPLLSGGSPDSCNWLLFSVLKISKGQGLNQLSMVPYVELLNRLTHQIMNVKGIYVKLNIGGSDSDSEDSDSDQEQDDAAMQIADFTDKSEKVARKALDMLNNQDIVSSLVAISDRGSEPGENEPALKALCRLCHQLLVIHPFALHKFKLLYTLAFRPVFLHRLWNLVLETKRPSFFGSTALPLLTVISRGIRMTPAERDEIVPLISVFTSLFGYLLVTIHDTEFYGESGSFSQGASLTNRTLQQKNCVWMPFSLKELVPMSLALRDVTLGLIELAFPESRPAVRDDYKLAVKDVQPYSETNLTHIWNHIFRSTVQLVRQLYTRDTRRQFCPDDHWINDRITLPLDRANDIPLRRSRLRQYRPFQGLRVFTREELVEEGPPLSAKEIRLATVLREIPYAISFNQRVHVFQNQIQRDKDEHQGDIVNFNQGKQIRVHIRRNFIYEDAFEKLSSDNEPNLRLKMRIQLVNFAGMDEDGIDGGGIFREFMTELIKTSFDPNRGFFRLTKDQHLYPNPNVEAIEPNYIPHFFFIGRMLGKALYENMLVELPLASFFLSKLLGQKSVNVDIDHLSSLDPELYKNLLYLKTYDGNVEELELDFTIVSEEVGKTQVEELKPNGSSIGVTNDNRIEYIHLVADFKLNRQIRSQCNAFRHGLSDVINLDWLRMFSHRELQTLISGAEHEIDFEDLQLYAKYGNGYSADHPTILNFWSVIMELSEEQKRRLLKFVTSCSRPPLLGFKELDPPFCIQNAGVAADRLPTASTCMNLLKLPDFKDKETLKTKLLYAIESESGFELS